MERKYDKTVDGLVYDIIRTIDKSIEGLKITILSQKTKKRMLQYLISSLRRLSEMTCCSMTIYMWVLMS